MRLLLLENDESVCEILGEAFAGSPDVEIDIVLSRDGGLEAVAQHSYDLAIFDLQVPTTDGALDEHVDHGMHVFSRLGELSTGTPRVVWTGKATVEAMAEIVKAQFRADPYGTGGSVQMVEFFDKEDLRVCVNRVREIAAHIDSLGSVSWSWGVSGGSVDVWPERVVGIFARRHGGVIVRAERVGGGFSGADTLRLEVRDGVGGLRQRVIGKVAELAEVTDEIRRYDAYLGVLPLGSYTPYVDRVVAGANGFGGAFYTLADSYTRSLFDLLGDPADAAKVVTRLRENTSNWRSGAPQVQVSVKDVREFLCDDGTASSECDKIDPNWAAAEETSIYARVSTAHGDLHGLNVLVDADGVAVLIDFGMVMPAVSSLDPVTLELSAMLHPKSPVRGVWPDCRPELWGDAGRFYEACPHKEFALACRKWAAEVAAEDREVAASGYAYCARQLKYPNADADLAAALGRAALTMTGA